MRGRQIMRMMTGRPAAARRGGVLLAVLLVAAPGYAQAPAAPYDSQTAFRQADTNNDGAVDQNEFECRMSDVFFFADVNKDGTLSQQEAAVTLVDTAADSNQNGSMSMHEFSRAQQDDFERADTNDDGLLEVQEVTGGNPPKP